MKSRAEVVTRFFACFALLLASTCGGSRQPSPALSTALQDPALGVGVTLGAPSHLEVDALAGQFVWGREASPLPSSGPFVRVGSGVQVRLAMSVGALTVSEPGSSAGVTLRPVAGPAGFRSWGPGAATGDSVVYPSGDGAAALVERASGRGVKEDLVLTRSLGDAVRFEWALELTEGLEARLEADGSIGVYGVSALLVGDVQVSDDRSRALLDLARKNAKKETLRFRLPAPTVRDASGAMNASLTHFELQPATGSHALLALVATGLDGLPYPLSLDPSVVVTLTADFGLAGYTEGTDVSGDQLKRGKTQRGVGAWSATTALPANRNSHASVISNGFLYVTGGWDGTTGFNDVLVAPLNANGSVGAFAATSTFTTARRGHCSLAYNGHLYVVGGWDGTTPFADVQVAPLNANGTVGAFVGTTALPSARDYFAAVASNGYLYVLGGSGSATFNDVQVAPINANGSLGAFTATSAFATARYGHSAVVWNGALYVLGGYSTTNLADVQFARINSDGTLGAFTATTSLPTARSYQTSVVMNGSLYVIGGTTAAAGATTNNLDEVQVAPLNANGTLGAFQPSTPLPLPRRWHSSAASNGFLYELGGFNGGAKADVQVAPITNFGNLGAFTATSTFATPREGHAAVVYNGYLYVIGGYNGAPLVSIEYALLNADGTVGNFLSATPLPSARYRHTAVAGNGYLYVIGGLSASSTLNDIRAAPINANGGLGSFISMTSLPSARSSHASVIGNGSLFVLGGKDTSGVDAADVQVASIGATGTLGPFTATTSLPSARSNFSSVAYAGHVYVIGGQAGSDLGDVLVAPIVNGSLGAFTATTALAVPRHSHSSVASNGHLYVAGGIGTGYFSDVQVAPINGDGSLGLFTTTTSVPSARSGHASVVANGALLIVGGTGASGYLNDAEVAPFASSGGSVGAFAATTAFTSARYAHATAATATSLYVLGGWTGSAPGYGDVQVAPITGSGALGAFATTTALPTPRYGLTSLTWGNFLYAVGGYSQSSALYLADVLVAPIAANGTLGSFTATTPLPTARRYHRTAAYNGHFYVVGGTGSGGGLSEVLVATINADGTLGSFSPTTPLPAARDTHACVAYNGFLYVLGGVSAGSNVGDVVVAPITPSGTLGAFTATSSLPSGRSGHTAVAENGYLYVIGGSGPSGAALSDVVAAPINSNGTLGTFVGVSSLPTQLRYHGSVAVNGSLYVTGGSSGGTSYNTVQLAPLLTPAARGTYSKLVDLGAAANLDSFTANGSGSRGTVRLEYRVAPATGIFGATIDKGVVPLGAVVTLGNSGTRYAWVKLTLDDTQAAVINPDATTERDVTDFTLGYSTTAPVVAPSAVSLPPRGTQTFACTGGSGSGYTFGLSPNASGASIVSASGLYTAGALGSVTDTVTCTDSTSSVGTATVTVGPGVSVSPTSATVYPRGTQAFTCSGGSNAGLAFSLSTNASDGGVSAAGLYTAGVVGLVTDMVMCTDSLGNTKTAGVTVTAGVALSPAALTVPPRAAQVFSASGGSDAGFVFALVTNASGANLVAASGAYTAGSTGGVTDVVRATDSVGNSTIASVTITAGVSVSPAAPSVAPRGSVALVASGGSGTGFTWTLTTDASGGATLNTTTGAYTAGAVGGVTDLVSVKDSLGNTANVSIAVGAGVSLSPVAPSVPPRGTVSFTPSGGSGTGFTFTLATNASDGGVTTGGTYTAGLTGSVTDVVRVTDSLGNTKTANVTVTAKVAIAPAAAAVAPGGSKSFVASGGSGSGFVWSLVTSGSGSPTINPANGAYVAGGTGNSVDVVRVTDSLGNVQTASVSVGSTLTITPVSAAVAPQGTQSFSASGGSGGFAWSLANNNSGGSIDPSTGAYKAGNTGGVTDVVQVKDSVNAFQFASVTVSASLAVSPGSAALAPKGSQQFTASGGSGTGFTWSVPTKPSGGSISASGLYTAGATGSVTDVVKVTDSSGNTASADVTVGAELTISPGLQSRNPGGASITFTASGGKAPYVFSLFTNASGATFVAGTATYTPGSSGGGIDTVRVTDANGATSDATISVSAGVVVSPASASTPPLGTKSFTVSGGSGVGYVWAMQVAPSGGSVSPFGDYTAGRDGGVTDVVQATDSLGNIATASVSVGAGVEVSPPPALVVPRGTANFTASGGSGAGFTWTLAAGPSGGSIDGGVYVAGPTGGVTDVVQASDSLGNVGTQSVAVGPGVSISPSSLTILAGHSKQFTASGGSGTGYVWAVVTDNSGAALNAAIGQYFAGSTVGVTDVLGVTDSLGNTQTVDISVVSTLPGDGGVSPDAGPSTDAGVEVDGGEGLADGGTTGKRDLFALGCSSGGSGSPTLLAAGLASLVFVRRRRKGPAPRAMLHAPRRRALGVQALTALACVLGPASTHAASKGIAMLELSAGPGVEKTTAAFVTEILVNAVQERTGRPVISSKDVSAALGAERQRQLLGCSGETSCLAEIGGALGTEQLVYGSLGKLGGRLILSVQLFNQKKSLVEQRYQGQVGADQEELLLGAAKTAAEVLFPEGRVEASGGVVSTAGGSDTGPLFVAVRPQARVGADHLSGAGAVAVGYRLLPQLRVEAGALASSTVGAFGRVTWLPLQGAWRPLVALEVPLMFSKSVLPGVGGALGIEYALSRRIAVAVEVPVYFFPTAGADTEALYVFVAAAVTVGL